MAPLLEQPQLIFFDQMLDTEEGNPQLESNHETVSIWIKDKSIINLFSFLMYQSNNELNCRRALTSSSCVKS